MIRKLISSAPKYIWAGIIIPTGLLFGLINDINGVIFAVALSVYLCIVVYVDERFFKPMDKADLSDDDT